MRLLRQVGQKKGLKVGPNGESSQPIRTHKGSSMLRRTFLAACSLLLARPTQAERESFAFCKWVNLTRRFDGTSDTIQRYGIHVHECAESAKDGYWNDPTTWKAGKVPGPGASVGIAHCVTFNTTGAQPRG